jgi:3-(methylthio)propanoyl-CoA dehydrogenase
MTDIISTPSSPDAPHRGVRPSSEYIAPVDDVELALHVAGLDKLLELDEYVHADRESVVVALREFGRLASEVLAPTDAAGDVVGARHDPATGIVTVPEEYRIPYARFVEGGWGALPFPTEYGGGGLPLAIGLALQEMFAAASLSLSFASMLTQGLIEALLQWGSDDQKRRFLPRLVTGEWTGAMNLTEPDAGSDLGEIRTQADQDGEGVWRLSGTKIFITWGEHDLTDNVVHLVLARTPDAPPGTKGLSLFLVSQRHLDAEQQPGERNTVRCLHIEHKLGIHGSPTCVMEYDRAQAELVGPRHNGMKAMFTMMNAARLSTGAQGPAVGERAYQQAHAYAAARVQGRATGVVPPARSPIIDHPDVRRMLASMATANQASRMLLYKASACGDLARHASDPGERERSQQFADLLTPVAKAWTTDAGFRTASTGLQVFGGAGYIEESGIAQRLRDARIAPVYEGTNGIQAIDLVMRKLPREGGRWVRELLSEVALTLKELQAVDDRLPQTLAALTEGLAHLESATEWMLDRVATSPDDVLAGATSYLDLFGTVYAGCLMAQGALRAIESGLAGVDKAVARSECFAVETTSRASGLVRAITSGSAHLDALFGARSS